MFKLKNLVCLVLVTMSIQVVSYTDTSRFDLDEVNSGIVEVFFPDFSKGTYKVMVKYDEETYFYNVLDDTTRIPLQLGSGVYEIFALKQKKGLTYEVIEKRKVSLTQKIGDGVFILNHEIISWNNKIKTTDLFTPSMQNMTAEEMVQAVHDNMIQNYKYDYQKIDRLNHMYIPIVDETIQSKKGLCYDFAVVYASALRSQSIPARVVTGYKSGSSKYHAWNEVLINGMWKTVDVTENIVRYEAGEIGDLFKRDNNYIREKIY